MLLPLVLLGGAAFPSQVVLLSRPSFWVVLHPLLLLDGAAFFSLPGVVMLSPPNSFGWCCSPLLFLGVVLSFSILNVGMKLLYVFFEKKESNEIDSY